MSCSLLPPLTTPSLASLSMAPEHHVETLLDRSNDSIEIEQDQEMLASQEKFEQLQNDVSNGIAEGKSSAEILMPFLFDMNEQLARLNRNVNDSRFGLKSRIKTVIGDTEDNTDRIIQLEQENKLLRDNQQIMIGLMQRQSETIDRMNSKIEDLIKRSMQDNIVIHNHEYTLENGQPAWDLRPVVLDFLKSKLNMDPDEREIFVAHKLGENSIVARVYPGLKNDVFQNVDQLKGVKNSKNKSVYITDQQPEAPRARRMYAKELEKELTASYSGVAGKKPKIEVKKDTVYVNNEPQKNQCPAPKPIDVLDIDLDEREKIDNVNLSEVEIKAEKGSKFRGLCTKASNRPEVRLAYKKARMMYPAATHIMCGYAIKTSKDKLEYGRDDDGEWGGSHRIVEAIKAKNLSNIVVFVIRQFGGQHLGAKRFDCIKSCAEKVIKESKIK